LTTLDSIKERLEVEYHSPGTYTRFDFIRDVEYLLGELEEVESELQLTRDLINWQCGAELDVNVA